MFLKKVYEVIAQLKFNYLVGIENLVGYFDTFSSHHITSAQTYFMHYLFVFAKN